MNQFRLFLFFLCICVISLSQENYNLKIDIADSQSVFLHSFSVSDSSRINISQDTTLMMSSTKNNLFYIENNSKKYYLFLTEDSQLDVVINANNVFCNGPNTSFVNFLNDYFNFHQFHFKSKLDSFSSHKTIDEFEILLYDFINNDLFDFYSTHMSFQDLSDQSKLYFQTLIKYEYLNGLSAFLFQKYTSDSKDFISSLNDVDVDLLDFEIFENSFNDVLYFKMDIFQNYIFNTLFLTLASRYNQPLDNIDDFQIFSIYFFNNMLKYIPSEFFSYCIKKYIQNFSFLFQQNTTNHLLSLMKEQQFEKNNITKIKEIIDSNYNPEQEKIVVDAIVIQNDFFMEDVNGKQVSLNMFKGKLLYVDIWASWCGPCRKQFPHSKELKNKFSKKQLKKIKFVYISIDNDYTKWKESMEKLNIEGYHFISPAKNSHSAGAYFGVSSIPRYIIIDKAGNIIEQNAKRPSDGTLFNELIELIN